MCQAGILGVRGAWKRTARTTDARAVSGLSSTENYMVTLIFILQITRRSFCKGGHEIVEVEDLGYIAIF